MSARRKNRSKRAKPEIAKVRRRFLRLPSVKEATGWGRTKIYEEIAKGAFPRQIRLADDGKAVGWDENEINAWQEARLAKRDQAAS